MESVDTFDINCSNDAKGNEKLLFDMIIIKCSSQFQDKRSAAAIFHLLKGRKSIQTQQDSFLYDLANFYGVYKKLHKQTFEKKLDQLQNSGHLQLSGESVLPGEKCTAIMQKTTEYPQFNYFNGMEYTNADTVFCQRLFLLIQTLTNSQHHHFSFIPVIDTPKITNWVKTQYKRMRHKQETVLRVIHNELHQLLGRLPEEEAEFFVDCLTGFEHYGMSSYQLAKHHKMERVDAPLFLTAITHRIFSEMEQDPEKFPTLSFVIKDMKHETKLSQSAGRTDTLLRNNYNPTEIASIRSLRINTIYDHIVEIALYQPGFSIDSYVSTEQQQEIAAAIREVKSFKLKDIKCEVDDNISYFQVRLVLAANHKGVR